MAPLKRGFFPALVLLAAGAIYLAEVAHRQASRSPEMHRERPLIVGLPGMRAVEDKNTQAAPSKDTNLSLLPARVRLIVERVQLLGSEDQAGLDRLNEEMRALIHGNEKEYAAYVAAKVPDMNTAPLEQSFFIVKALITNVEDASVALKALLSAKAVVPANAHDEASRLNLIKSFAIEQWAESQTGGVSGKTLLPILVDLAKHEKDLAVARQALEGIARRRLVVDTESLVREVLRSRKPNEAFAFDGIHG